MRYEQVRGNNKPTKWFTIDIMPMTGDEFAVVMTYGMKDPQGEDAIIQPLKSVYNGKYQDAMQVLLAKVANREKVGYVNVEPTSE